MLESRRKNLIEIYGDNSKDKFIGMTSEYNLT